VNSNPEDHQTTSWKFVIHKNENGLYHVAEEYYDEKGKVEGWTEGEILLVEEKADLIPLLEQALKDLSQEPT
jgi:hypothetical protein